MEEKKLVPKLRFPGFTEPWEQRKLGDYLVVSYLKNFEGKYDKEDVLSVSGDYGIVNQIDFQGRSFAGKSVLNYGIVGMGDIVYTKSPLKKNPFGIIKTNKLNSGIVSTLYAIYTPKKNCNAIFVEHYFELDSRLNEYLKPLVNKGAKNDMKVSSEKALDGNIIFPAIEEQKRISAFLEFFGRYITLHQRKLEHLKLKKKSLLQKLFPKEGEVYPEFRFPGFTDPWEQRKLGECMNSFAYGLNAAAKGYDGMHKYIRITDIDDETHNFIQSNLASPDIDFNMDVSHYKLNVGDIVFARTGASVGKTYLYNPNDGDLYYAGFLIRGKVKEDCDAGFIYQNTLTKGYDSFIKITSQRSGQPGVNSKEYATFRLNIPCKDEQEKISKVLNSLDELFTLHQRKLEHLQLLKKALLQQLFV